MSVVLCGRWIRLLVGVELVLSPSRHSLGLARSPDRLIARKGSKAMDRAVGADEPVESYWKTELKHSLAVRGAGSTARRGEDREGYAGYGESRTRKMSQKERESRARLSALVAEHAPSRK